MAAPGDATQRLIERLVSDPAFRAALRADPAGAVQSAGLEDVDPALLEELRTLGASGLEELEVRESRSSLAGALVAAALEGVALIEVDPAQAAAAPSVDHPASPRAAGPVVPEPAGRAPLARAASASPAGPARLMRVVPPPAGRDVPDPSHAPPGRDPRGPSNAVPDGRRPMGDARPRADDGLFEVGGPKAEVVQLLHNRHVTFDATGISDLRAGRIDRRIVAILQALSRDHDITISAMRSDHGQLTSGGSVSNHWYGRAADIAVVDGVPVSPGNSAAKELALALAQLPASIRPTEVGSPWDLPGTVDFTDAEHQNHIHVAFDDPPPDGWRPPADAGAGPQRPDSDEVRWSDGYDGGDEDDDDDGDDAEGDDGDVREDGGSGDTEAEADAESDGDGDEA